MKVSSKIEALLFVAGNEGLTLTEISHMINLSTASLYNEITELKKLWRIRREQFNDFRSWRSFYVKY